MGDCGSRRHHRHHPRRGSSCLRHLPPEDKGQSVCCPLECKFNGLDICPYRVFFVAGRNHIFTSADRLSLGASDKCYVGVYNNTEESLSLSLSLQIKDCFASPYKKLPTDIHIETITF